jgi:hypothetical protein
LASTKLAHRADGIYFERIMIDAPEKRLIEALKNVDAHGDVAPAHPTAVFGDCGLDRVR